MREAQIRAAAEWKRPDLLAVKELIEDPAVLSLDGLITHREHAAHADAAYRTAFGDVTA
jgi:3-hydroxyethyl bacteriochlorophyllide a dehydrogenase